MSKQLSGRDFLKLSGIASTGMLLSACGITPKEIPTLTPANITTSTPKLMPTTTPTTTLTPTPFPTTLRGLADKSGIEVGAEAPIGYFLWNPEGEEVQSKYRELFFQEYSMVFSAWEFLWAIQETVGGKPFRPDREHYDFHETDLLVDFYRKNGLRIQVNNLIWGYKAALPSWLKNGNFSQNDLLDIARTHIQTVVGRYKGKIQEWIVVNEIFGNPWESNLWQKKLGSSFDWVEKAFGWANEADPQAKLILNDFGIEILGIQLYDANKDSRIFNLVRDLKDKNVPIDGIGFQMHLYAKDFFTQKQLETKMKDLSENIQKYKRAGIDVYVTEFDLGLDGVPGSQTEKFDVQGKIYGAILKTCLENGIKSFCVFGLTDKYSWHPDTDPLPFDDNFNPKPAYYAMLDVLQQYAH